MGAWKQSFTFFVFLDKWLKLKIAIFPFVYTKDLQTPKILGSTISYLTSSGKLPRRTGPTMAASLKTNETHKKNSKVLCCVWISWMVKTSGLASMDPLWKKIPPNYTEKWITKTVKSSKHSEISFNSSLKEIPKITTNLKILNSSLRLQYLQWFN